MQLKCLQIQSTKLLKHIISRVELILKPFLVKEFALRHSDREKKAIFRTQRGTKFKELQTKEKLKKINRIRTSNHDDGTNKSMNFF